MNHKYLNQGSREMHLKTAGTGSWYGKRDRTEPFAHIRNAYGTLFDENALTCAMRNGKRLNRVIDLSKGAFKSLTAPKAGTIRVKVERVRKG